MGAMRRENREIKDGAALRAIIERATTLRIGAADDEGMFIVPVSFGYVWDDGGAGAPVARGTAEGAPGGGASGGLTARAELPTFYIHSARAGRKARAFSRGADVAFELDEDLGVVSGASACAYSYAFRSIMGTGRIVPIEDADEKRRGLALIMEHMAPDAPREFPDAMVERTAVFRIDVREMAGKGNAAD